MKVLPLLAATLLLVQSAGAEIYGSFNGFQQAIEHSNSVLIVTIVDRVATIDGRMVTYRESMKPQPGKRLQYHPEWTISGICIPYLVEVRTILKGPSDLPTSTTLSLGQFPPLGSQRPDQDWPMVEGLLGGRQNIVLEPGSSYLVFLDQPRGSDPPESLHFAGAVIPVDPDLLPRPVPQPLTPEIVRGLLRGE